MTIDVPKIIIMRHFINLVQRVIYITKLIIGTIIMHLILSQCAIIIFWLSSVALTLTLTVILSVLGAHCRFRQGFIQPHLKSVHPLFLMCTKRKNNRSESIILVFGPFPACELVYPQLKGDQIFFSA